MEKYGESRRSKENPRLNIQTREFAENVFLEHFLGAVQASLSVAKLWPASEVRTVSAWERALPSPLPRPL